MIHVLRACRLALAGAFAGILFIAGAARTEDPAPAAPPAPPEEVRKADPSPVLKAMEAELTRSFEKLKTDGPDSLYYLRYSAAELDQVSIAAQYGAVVQRPTDTTPYRSFLVHARAGAPSLDNTHQIRGGYGGGYYGRWGQVALPVEDDLDALRTALWLATDGEVRGATETLASVRTDQAMSVKEDDPSDDFSVEPPRIHLLPPVSARLDAAAWERRIAAHSAEFKGHPHVLYSGVSLEGGSSNISFADSTGTRLQYGRTLYRLYVLATTKAEDGMEMYLTESFESPDAEGLPDDTRIKGRVDRIITDLERLRTAPVVEPFVGPAILMNRAAAVFFHEIFGHRIEGHRQKDVREGQTFRKKLGEKIMPEFISIVDDPTQQRFGDAWLLGNYLFDEEGVPAQAVTVVEKGILRNFLMGRSPIEGFPRSNGHGRAQTGLNPVSRQGNLLVRSEKRVPFDELKKMLIEEAKKQGKPYGLIFHDIAGGFTTTLRAGPQAFKVLPLFVTRVHVDDGHEEVVRGVDIVGTPIMCLDQIVATGDDDDVFNGFCGAESGSIPVSAVSPSLLVSRIEVEKRRKEQDRPPLLPPPLHDTGTGGEGTDHDH